MKTIDPTTMNISLMDKVIEAAQIAAAGEPSWLRAIDKAAEELRANPRWYFERGTLVFDSSSERTYIISASGHHEGCKAYEQKTPCYHRAIRKLLSNYEQLLRFPLDESEPQRVILVGAQPKLDTVRTCNLCFKPLKSTKYDVHTKCALYENHRDEIIEFAAQVKAERATYRHAPNQPKGERFNGMDV